jgi:hypothetical protein
MEAHRMPEKKANAKVGPVNPDYVRMYYEHQYDRIKKHEDQALNISNIVLTISSLIITFGLNNRQSFGSIFIFFLPAILIIANVFAILYVRDSGNWIRSHRLRAKRILENYIPEIFILDKETIASHEKKPVGRKRFQITIHSLFIGMAVILTILFTLELMGVSI